MYVFSVLKSLFFSLYQLKKNLNTWIANVTVGPVKDFRNCLPGKECEHEKVLTNNTNRLLLIDKNKNRLIACGSVYQVCFSSYICYFLYI